MIVSRKTLTAKDWLEGALQVLASEGVSAIAIEPLAKKLGVTKGSFYWHYKNRSALLDALLDFWEGIEVAYVRDLNRQNETPEMLLEASLYILINDETNKHVFLGLSSASGDKTVKAVYLRAVSRRISLFTSAFTRMGFGKDEAQERALKIYCSYLGLIKTLVDNSHAPLNEMSGTQKVDMVLSNVMS